MSIKFLFRILFFTVLSFLLFGFYCYFFIAVSSGRYTSYNVYDLPNCTTALVLGTSRKLASGQENPYYLHRMSAAEKIYKTKKAALFILSGDNRKENYNEPREMKKSLLARGIPDSCLIADYAGLRTFDSMVRSQKVFGQDTIIVVSQAFHNARAVFIARKIGLTIYGYNANMVEAPASYRVLVREFFSRIKCVLDLYVLNTQPQHLGEKIIIE